MYGQFMAILNLKSPVYHPMYGAFLLFSCANKIYSASIWARGVSYRKLHSIVPQTKKPPWGGFLVVCGF